MITKISNISFQKSFNKPARKSINLPTSRSMWNTVCNLQQKDKGQLRNSDGSIFVRSTTEMFRSDINWRAFGNYLRKRFEDSDKVDTYVYACSTGAEAYSMSILLQTALSQNAQKFFPIHALDISPERILRNEKERHFYTVNKRTYECINMLNGFSFDNYPFVRTSQNGKKVLSEGVVGKVKFRQANILKDINSISKTNPSIVMCRNMWRYVNPIEYKHFAKQLYKALPKKSVVVIGAYDWEKEKGRPFSNKFPNALIKAGFKPSAVKFGTKEFALDVVFEKN